MGKELDIVVEEFDILASDSLHAKAISQPHSIAIAPPQFAMKSLQSEGRSPIQMSMGGGQAFLNGRTFDMEAVADDERVA